MTSDHLSESNHGKHSPASNVTYVDGNQPRSPHRNGSCCGRNPLHGDQTKTKCEIVSSRLKTEDEDCGAVSSVVAEVLLNPIQPVKLCSDGKDHHTAAERPEQPEETRDRKHFCPICKKELRTQSHRCQHTKKLHGGVRPYRCIYCRKRFTSRYPLIVHLRTHTKEKPFFCPVCGMNFSLMRHVKSQIKTNTKKTAVMTDVQKEEDTVGGLINSDGEELEWDAGSSSKWK